MPSDTALDWLPDVTGGVVGLLKSLHNRYAPLSWVHNTVELARLRPDTDTPEAATARETERKQKTKELEDQKQRLKAAFNAIILAQAHIPENLDQDLVTTGLKRVESTAIRTALWTGWYLDLAASGIVSIAVLYAALPLAVGDMQTQFFGSLMAHGIIGLVTKGFSMERTGRANDESNEKGRYMSKDVALLLQTISSQAVLISSMALFSTSQWDVIIRRLFHLNSYKGGILGAHRVFLDDQVVHNLNVFLTPARLIGQTIGMALIGPMVLTLSDRMSSFMIRTYTTTQKKKGVDGNKLDETHHDYLRQLSVLRVAGQSVAMVAQIWLPYLISQHAVLYHLGFAFGGLGYGAKYFVEDLIKHTPKTKEDWGNTAFRVSMAASLGMVLYPIMPWYMIVPDRMLPNGDIIHGNLTNAILLGTAICAVDAVTKQFILPALSDSKMTWDEKLDLALSAMTLAAMLGFTLSASVYTQTAAGDYMMMATGFSPHLPGMLGFLLYLVAMPILYRMKEEGRFVAKEKEVPLVVGQRLRVLSEERIVLLSNNPAQNKLILGGKIMVRKGDTIDPLAFLEGEHVMQALHRKIPEGQILRVQQDGKIVLLSSAAQPIKEGELLCGDQLGGKLMVGQGEYQMPLVLDLGDHVVPADTIIVYDNFVIQYDNNLGFLEQLTKNFPAKERIKYSTNQFIFDILANVFGSIMVTTAFNMVLGSEAYKLIGEWLDKQALTNQSLGDFLSWYKELTGTPLSYTLAFGFCMSFVFIGMEHVYKRLYQSGTHHDVLKVAQRDSDTQYTFIEMLWRFGVEMAKYSMRFTLTEVIYKNLVKEGTVLIDPLFDKFMCYIAVHLLTGLTIGFFRKALKELILSPKRVDHWQELVDHPTQKLAKWGIGSLNFAFDQVFYYFNGAAIDRVVEDYREGIPDSHTTAMGFWGSAGAACIEVAEIVYWELLEAIGKVAGLIEGVDTRDQDMAVG